MRSSYVAYLLRIQEQQGPHFMLCCFVILKRQPNLLPWQAALLLQAAALGESFDDDE